MQAVEATDDLLGQRDRGTARSIELLQMVSLVNEHFAVGRLTIHELG